MRLTMGVCRSNADLSNKTAIVTGSDKEIGYCTAYDFAQLHDRVIMACRDLENARKMAETIRQETNNRNVIVRKLDLSSLESVRNFAKEVLVEETRLDILVNNAGMTNRDGVLRRTPEGFEQSFVTNYLGHFLLTMLLIDLMKKSEPSHIVNVSSIVRKWVKPLDLGNLNAEKFLDGKQVYGHTKMEQILSTRYLAK